MVYRGYTNRWVRTCQEQLFRAIRAYDLNSRTVCLWSNVDYSGQLARHFELRGEVENSAPANTAFEAAAPNGDMIWAYFNGVLAYSPLRLEAFLSE